MYFFRDEGYLAIIYMAIFGFVVVTADTAVLFTKFTQKEMIIVIHSLFYIGLLITGIAALVSDSEFRQQMQTLSQRTC